MRGIITIAMLDPWFLSIGVIGAAGVPRLFHRLTPADVGRLSRVPGLFGGGHPAFLSLAVGAIAVVTFLGILRMGVSSLGSGPGEPWIQRAIVIAVVTVYLVLISAVTFFPGGGRPTRGDDLPPRELHRDRERHRGLPLRVVGLRGGGPRRGRAVNGPSGELGRGGASFASRAAGGGGRPTRPLRRDHVPDAPRRAVAG